MFSLICVWINGWVNNREAGDLKRYRTHYDVLEIIIKIAAQIAGQVLTQYCFSTPVRRSE